MKKFLSIATCLAVTSLSAQTLSVEKGWNLLGSNVNNVDISQFNSNVKIVWKYKNGKWYAGSNSPELNMLIQKDGFGLLKNINAGEGFWVLSTEKGSLNLNGEKAKTASLMLVKGWNLVSLLSDDAVSVNSFNKPDVASIWKWDAKNGKWMAWTNNAKLKPIFDKYIKEGKLEAFDTINPGEGFWIQELKGNENPNYQEPPKVGFVYEALNENNAVPVENAKVYTTNGELIGTTDKSGKIDLSDVADNTNVIVKKKGLALAYGTVKNGKLVLLTQKDTLNKVPLTATGDNQKVAKKGISSQDGSVTLIVNSMKLNQDITVGIVPFMTPAAAPALNSVTVDGEIVPVKQMAIIGGAQFSLESSDGKELTPDEVNGTVDFVLSQTKMLGDIQDILNGGDTQNYQKFSQEAYNQLSNLISEGMVDVLVLQYENGKWVYKGKGGIKSYTKKKKVNGELKEFTKYKLVSNISLNKLEPVAFVMKMNYLTGEAKICATEGGYKMFDGSIVKSAESNSSDFDWINNPIPNVSVIGDSGVTSAPELTEGNGCETITYKVPFLDPNFHVTLKKDKYYDKLITCSVDVNGATCDSGVMFRVPDTASVEGYVRDKVTKEGIDKALVTLVNPEVLSADKIQTGDENGTSFVKVGYMPNVTYTWTARKVDDNGTELYSEVIKTGKGDPEYAQLSEKEIYDALVKPFDDGEGKFDAGLLTGNWQLVVKADHSFTNTDTKYVEEATGNFDINLLMPKLAALMSGQLSEKQVEVYVDENGEQQEKPKGLKTAAIYGGFSLGFLYEYGAQNDKFEWQTTLLGDATDLTDETGVLCNDYNSTAVSNCIDDPIADKIDVAYLNIAKGDTLTYSKSLYPVGLNVKYMAKHFKELLSVDPESDGEPFIKSGFTLRTLFNGEIDVPQDDGTTKPLAHLLASYADISGANSVEDVLDTPSISLAGESVTAYMRKVLTKKDGYYRINMIPPTLSGGLEIFAKASGYKFDVNSDIKLVNDLEKGKVSEYDLELEPVNSDVNITTKPVTAFDDWNFTNNCVESVKWQVMPNPLDIEVNNSDWAKTVWGDENISLLPDKDTSTNGYIWFGDKETGMFSDTGENTSSQKVCGEAITPLIDLTNNAFPVLKFKSWFEVESVDVAKYQFDQMKVGFIIPKSENGGKDEVTVYNSNGEALTVKTDKYYTIGRLNPSSEPVVQDPKVPYSSAGDGILPVWNNYMLNAAGLAGYKVKFVFNFNSNDSLFNGFRGWGIDSVSVDENQSVSIAMPPMVPNLNTTNATSAKKR